MERGAALDVGGEVDPLRVGAPGHLADRVVEPFGQDPAPSRPAIHDRDPEAVRFPPRHSLRAVGEPTPVGGVGGGAVPGLVGGGAVVGPGELVRRAVHRHRPDVGVGRGGLVGLAVRGEGQLFPVGRQRHAEGAAHGERRRIKIARGQVARRGIRLRQVVDEDVGALGVAPLGPMPEQEPIGQVGLELRLGAGLVLLLVAGGVGPALDPDIGAHRQHVPIARHRERPHSTRKVGPRVGLAAAHGEDLRVAIAGGEEVERPAVRREARGRVGLVGKGEGLGVRAVGVHPPEVGLPLHRRQVRRRHLVDDRPAVRRNHRLLDALEPVEVGKGERPLLGGAAGARTKGQGEDRHERPGDASWHRVLRLQPSTRTFKAPGRAAWSKAAGASERG